MNTNLATIFDYPTYDEKAGFREFVHETESCKTVVVLVHEDQVQEAMEVFQDDFTKNFADSRSRVCRVVTTYEDLFEKMLIVGDGYRDDEMEMLKLFCKLRLLRDGLVFGAEKPRYVSTQLDEIWLEFSDRDGFRQIRKVPVNVLTCLSECFPLGDPEESGYLVGEWWAVQRLNDTFGHLAETYWESHS